MKPDVLHLLSISALAARSTTIVSRNTTSRQDTSMALQPKMYQGKEQDATLEASSGSP